MVDKSEAGTWNDDSGSIRESSEMRDYEDISGRDSNSNSRDTKTTEEA